ncbi:hypothetical protein [Streptomyces fuscichromogenes]|uniref:Uncharacterized protein n=1 Tax=Streptomyces fuscichromogenes TaxID=1324013 RepID=A0A917XPE3_9ACTN|nr:hypothetical protein [Streptomyces fuscichromogenes]GGN44765.1 hypothetical protein GCM10011578_096070 [Streptomyces fuscichromogenes]
MSDSPGSRPGSGARLATARRLLQALTGLLLVCLAVFGAPAAAMAADGDLVKVFVVQDPAQTGGTLVTLGAIAKSTLGDESRAGDIFTLNRGLTQKDGSSLNSPDEALHPGWILRLPEDASGPDVQLARDTSGGQTAGSGNQVDGTAAPTDGSSSTGNTAVFTIPLASAIAVASAFVLALVTAAIVSRRGIKAWAAAFGRAMRRLGDPARRRRRLAVRRSIGSRFAADADSVRRAYEALGDFAATPQRPAVPVHALRVDESGAMAWLDTAEAPDDTWALVDGACWQRSASNVGWLDRPDAVPQANTGEALLVRVGTDEADCPVFVDLSRLDGVLSVTGNAAVARDVVQNLLAEVARNRPETPITVLGGADGSPLPAVPPTLRQLPRVEQPLLRADTTTPSIIRSPSNRHPVVGVVVVAGTPGPRETAELEALCGPQGSGWTGFVYGDAVGAHWQWHADEEGCVTVPVLPLRLTVPA